MWKFIDLFHSNSLTLDIPRCLPETSSHKKGLYSQVKFSSQNHFHNFFLALGSIPKTIMVCVSLNLFFLLHKSVTLLCMVRFFSLPTHFMNLRPQTPDIIFKYVTEIILGFLVSYFSSLSDLRAIVQLPKQRRK